MRHGPDLPELGDATPFEDSSPRALVDFARRLLSRRSAARFERHRRLVRWAQLGGHGVDDEVVVVTLDGVACRVPIADVTGGSARVRARARVPVATRFTAEPARRGGDLHVDARDVALARRLLDAEVCAALDALQGWARITYDAGAIEVLIDASPMCGARLVEGARVASRLARVDPLGVV